MVTYISGKVACCNHLISVEMLQSTEKIWFAKDKLGCNSFTPVLQFYTSGKVAINGKDWVHQFDRNLLQKCVNRVNRAWNKKLTDIWRPPFGWKWNEAASDLELFLPNVYCHIHILWQHFVITVNIIFTVIFIKMTIEQLFEKHP